MMDLGGGEVVPLVRVLFLLSRWIHDYVSLSLSVHVACVACVLLLGLQRWEPLGLGGLWLVVKPAWAWRAAILSYLHLSVFCA